MPDDSRTDGSFARLAKLFEPRAVAVIGASDEPGNLGGRAVMLLRKFSFPGAIWPVNPRRDSVQGLPCFHSVGELPGPADLAIIAISAKASVAAVRDCARAGIRHGVLWAGGFAEAGEEGGALQQVLQDACRETGFLLCGPNSLGIINAWLPLTATFASSLVTTERLYRGDISMVSQSGGMAMNTQALAQEIGLGFRLMISSGNEAVLSMSDYLNALVDDTETRVIAVYAEGIRDGAAFLAALARARRAGKPVVMLKAGLSEATRRAAAAHTGAFVGDNRVWQSILREQAVIPVQSVRELADVAMYMSSTGRAELPRGRGVAIVSFGGGGGVVATDLCARRGLETPPLAASTLARLAPLVPPIASTANPIDLTPATFELPWRARLPEALDTIAADPGIDSLFFAFGAMARGGADVARTLVAFRERATKAVCISWSFAPAEAIAILAEAGVFHIEEPSRALNALAHAVDYAMTSPVRGTSAPLLFDWQRQVPDPVAGTVVSEDACHRILAAAGLPVARAELAASEEASVAAAQRVGFPVAIKGIAAAVTHRAAAGLLALDLRSEPEVRDAHRRLAARAAELAITLDGLYVQHMAQGRLELIVSTFRDPVFGVMVACGAGGNLTEIIDDVTLERAPFDVAHAHQVLQRLRIVRGAAKVDPGAGIDAVAGFVARFSQLAASVPWRRFVLEVNPIKWHTDGVTAVDGLLIVEEP